MLSDGYNLPQIALARRTFYCRATTSGFGCVIFNYLRVRGFFLRSTQHEHIRIGTGTGKRKAHLVLHLKFMTSSVCLLLVLLHWHCLNDCPLYASLLSQPYFPRSTTHVLTYSATARYLSLSLLLIIFLLVVAFLSGSLLCWH